MSNRKARRIKRLEKENSQNLKIVSNAEFSKIVQSVFERDYKNVPNITRLPNIPATLRHPDATVRHPELGACGGFARDLSQKLHAPLSLRKAFALIDKFSARKFI